MSNYASEIYIIDVTRGLLGDDKDDKVRIQVQRNDGQWYDEDFTLIGTTDDPGDVGGIIEEDWAETSELDWEIRKQMKKRLRDGE